MKRAALVLASLLALPAVGLRAQETISTDRPGIGSGSTVISPGIFQVEGGVSFARDGGIDGWSLGQLFLRYGVSGRVEAELLVNSLRVQRGEGGTADSEGLEDVGIGAKVRVLQGERATFSLQALVTSPTGATAFTSDEWHGTLNGLLDVGLTEAAALSVNAGVRPATGDLPTTFTANVTPGLALDGGFGIYGGWAGWFTRDADVNWLEAGGTLLLGRSMQLDLNGAWSVDEDSWFLGAGVAMRWGAGS